MSVGFPFVWSFNSENKFKWVIEQRVGCQAHPFIGVESYYSYSPVPLTTNPLGPNPVEDEVPAILAR